MSEKYNFKYYDNDTPNEHTKLSCKEYLFSMLPFVLLILLALAAFVLLI
ncbi:MAG: hypothetical protein K9L26_01045 [Candidatus Izimaplasma sp.]|nr:hypothetical protein [Candidatus Izimaplasma bacterium]